MIRKKANQKEVPTPKTEVGKTKLTNMYQYVCRKPSEQLSPDRRPLNYPKLDKNMKTYIRFKQHKNNNQPAQRVSSYMLVSNSFSFRLAQFSIK